MRNYVGVRRRTRLNVKRLILVIAIVAVVIAAGSYVAYANEEIRLDSDMEQELLTNGRIRDGVSIEGVDVSGLTMAEAQVAISPVVNQMLNSQRIEFTVQGVDDPYIYSLEDMGVSVDPVPVLRDAMLYGREGKRWDLEHEELAPQNFTLQKTFNIGDVATRINAAEAEDEWGEPAVNANFEVKKSKDEDDLTTSAQLVPTEPHDGYAIDKDEVITTIENQIMSESCVPFEAPVEVIESKSATDVHGGELSLMGTTTTDFSKSKADRRYNIWKMSSILNGAILDPGDTFSVNDTAGDRNEENGWKEADGIENGQFTPQYGGGICQVSTTLYNSCLKAELDIVNRVPHSIASSYVPKGLDATISTGGPDFKFSNPYDTPIYVIIKCDGDNGSLTAEIWGYDDRDYKVSLHSSENLEERRDLPKPEYQRNTELPNGQIQRVRAGQQEEVWNVYKDRIDKETGETIEKDIYVTKSTYRAIPPLYDVGPGVDLPANGTPIEQVKGTVSTGGESAIQATPAPATSAPATDEPQHTQAPEPTKKPAEPDPTKKPDPTQAPSTPEPTREPDPVTAAPEPTPDEQGPGDENFGT